MSGKFMNDGYIMINSDYNCYNNPYGSNTHGIIIGYIMMVIKGNILLMDCFFDGKSY